MHFIDSNIIFLCGNHEKEFVSYIDLLLQIDKDNDLFTDYTSIDDCQFLYDTSMYTIKRKAPDFLKLFDIYNTLYCLLFIDKVPLSELITYTEMINKMSFYYRYNPKTIIVHAGFVENIEKSLGKYKSIEDFALPRFITEKNKALSNEIIKNRKNKEYIYMSPSHRRILYNKKHESERNLFLKKSIEINNNLKKELK